MGILSANNLPCTNDVHVYDFSSDVSQVYGGIACYKEIAPGLWGMPAGDANSNGVINEADKMIWRTEAGSNGYRYVDFNLDGQISHKDINDLWIHNLSFYSQVPE